MPTYVRVKDSSTGHEFDVPEDSILLRRGHVTEVKSKRYPPSPVPRPAKHRPAKLASRPAGAEPTPDRGAADQPTQGVNNG